jgi:hypothetical protein
LKRYVHVSTENKKLKKSGIEPPKLYKKYAFGLYIRYFM